MRLSDGLGGHEMRGRNRTWLDNRWQMPPRYSAGVRSRRCAWQPTWQGQDRGSVWGFFGLWHHKVIIGRNEFPCQKK